MLLNICEFHADRHREGRAFLTDVSNMPFTCTDKPYDIRK
jgi:hypothetical protein